MSPHKDRGFRPTVSFIVPVCSQARLTTKCFASIRAAVKVPYEIVWVDNGSATHEIRQVRHQATRPRMHTKLLKFDQNIGFVKATNAGIKEAEGEFVILLNNDTEVGWKLATRLIKPLMMDRKIGATGPVTDSSIGWQGIVNLNRRWNLKFPKFRSTTDTIRYSKEIREIHTGKGLEVGGRKLPLSFFCCCMRRSLFKEIGLLDEDFGIGLGDDDDMALRMAAYGYKQYLVLDAFCKHLHRTTFNELNLEVSSLRRHSIAVLKRKFKQGVYENKKEK